MNARPWLAGVLAGLLAVILSPVSASAAAPQAEAWGHKPVGDTGIFTVVGTRTLPQGAFGVGLGWYGIEAITEAGGDDLDQNTFYVPLAYGIRNNLQIEANLPFTFWEADKSKTNKAGLDDITVGVRYRFLDEAAGRPGLGILGFVAAPTASKDKGIGTKETDYGAKLLLTKTLGTVETNVNVGYTVVGEPPEFKRDNEVTYGVGLAFPAGKKLQGLAEIAGNSDRNPDHAASRQLEGRAGLRYVTDKVVAHFGASRAFTSSSPDWGLTAGVAFLFGVKKAEAAPAAAPAAPAAPAAAAPAAPAAVPASLVAALEDVHFDFDRAALRPEGKKILDRAAEELKKNPGVAVVVEGHTCDIGTTEYNLALGDRRARSAYNYLVLLGIPADRLSTISYGEEKPAYPNDVEANRAKNRRAHFTVKTR